MGDELLVVGAGSIGERHVRNLAALGAGPLLVCDTDAARRDAVARAHGAEPVARLEAGLARGPRAVLVCTPPDSHLAVALAAARAGCHLFVEKPLAPTPAGIGELRREVEARGLIALVACNLRFHPAVACLKRLLDAGAIGRVLSAHLQYGHYLPGWRPSVDYRQVYSAHRAAGGGILLDAIHEVDYLGWFLGPVVSVTCLMGKVSDLEIDTEDTVEMGVRTASGALASLHLDYTQRAKRRRCELVGTDGTLIWESRGKEPERAVIDRYDAAAGRWESWEEPVDFNLPLEREMAHFLACLAGAEPPLQDLAAGERAVAVVEAARRAAETGRTVHLP